MVAINHPAIYATEHKRIPQRLEEEWFKGQIHSAWGRGEERRWRSEKKEREERLISFQGKG